MEGGPGEQEIVVEHGEERKQQVDSVRLRAQNSVDRLMLIINPPSIAGTDIYSIPKTPSLANVVERASALVDDPLIDYTSLRTAGVLLQDFSRALEAISKPHKNW